jgi:hypothetical protein
MDAWNDACAEQLQVEALITCDERVTFTMEFLQADKNDPS